VSGGLLRGETANRLVVSWKWRSGLWPDNPAAPTHQSGSGDLSTAALADAAQSRISARRQNKSPVSNGQIALKFPKDLAAFAPAHLGCNLVAAYATPHEMGEEFTCNRPILPIAFIIGISPNFSYQHTGSHLT
jgi:hypothetical protein